MRRGWHQPQRTNSAVSDGHAVHAECRRTHHRTVIFLLVGMGSLVYNATMDGPLPSATGTPRTRWIQRWRARPLAAHDYSMAGRLRVGGITRSSSSRGTIWKCPLDQVGLCHNGYHNAMAQRDHDDGWYHPSGHWRDPSGGSRELILGYKP